jgi:outer membrane receptor protein involved in Fe transport
MTSTLAPHITINRTLGGIKRYFRCSFACLSLIATGHAALAGDLDKLTYFHIEAQTLSGALLEFGTQAHMQIIVASGVSRTKALSHLVRGSYTGKQALASLLRESGLTFVEHGNIIEIVPTPLPASSGHSTEKIGHTAENNARTDPPTVPRKNTNKPAENAAVTELQEVVVTGTHIQGAPETSPLIRVTREEIDQSGYTTVGEMIQSLPDDFGNSGPQMIIGSAPNGEASFSGAPSPNLLGLGAASTLTLVDGQRLAVDSTTGSVDISLVPLAAVDHIDVLTGGESAIYGSDAVAGVVNIVLKRSFEGAESTLLGGGTANGGGTERDFNEMLGKTWSSGGAIFDYESDTQDPILARQRDYTASAGSLTTTLPGTARSSFLLNAHQAIGPTSVFVTGLYTHRTVSDAFSNGPLYPSLGEEVGVHQYAADGGLDAPLPFGWSASVTGDFSEERTIAAYAVLGPSPEAAPLLLNEGLTKSLEAMANGPVFALPTGQIRSAVGSGYRIETYDYATGGASETPGARRTVKFAYAELELPLLKPSDAAWRGALVIDLSGRFEKYSDFGDESIPKIGLSYSPFSAIKIRATWGKAFRAPTLFEMDGSHGLYYAPLADPLSPTGVSNVLETAGGNPNLSPETARTSTFGVDYSPTAVDGLRVSATYFNIAYRNRISEISNLYTALTDPLNAPFVIRAPSEGYVESLLNSADFITNFVGSSIDPNNVSAVVDTGDVNVASEDVDGMDIGVTYRRSLSFGQIEPFVNSTLLDLRQRLVPGAPEAEISGQVFEPPKVRVRGGASWTTLRWTVAGIVNYAGSQVNTYQVSSPHVSSWTTMDFTLAWHPEPVTVLGRFMLNLSVQNAFNREPPFVQFDQFVPGIHYDPLNANALGRVIKVGATWSLE